MTGAREAERLPLLLAIDGDWLEYNVGERPNRARFIRYLENEIAFCHELLQGKYVHLVHCSPSIGLYFLEPEFAPYYRRIVEQGGDLGIHLHMDLPNERYGLFTEHLPLIRKAIARMRQLGFPPVAHRGGYFSYDASLTRMLEDEGIRLELSNIPGRRMVHRGQVVSDWTGAPTHPYRLDEADHRRAGMSGVWEVPVAARGREYLCLERITPAAVARIVNGMRGCPVASAVTHTYMFADLFYSDHSGPAEHNYSASRALYLLTREVKRLCRRYPAGRHLLSRKRSSWHVRWFRGRMRGNLTALNRRVRFVNGRETLALLERAPRKGA